MAFFLTISRDIGFIHCRALLNKQDKRVSNGLILIVRDYESRGFKVVSASGDRAFDYIKEWSQQELGVTITTCDSDLHVP